MRFLAAFVMRGRMEAILAIAVSAFLSPLLPPLTYLSGTAVGLVTLRVGGRQGFGVIAGSALAVALLSELIFRNPLPGLGFALVLWLPVWVLAVNLRRSVRLERGVILASLFGMALVIGIHLATGDPASWWQAVLEKVLAPTLEGATKAHIDEMHALVDQSSKVMSGFVGGLLGLNLLVCLFIARWWQAQLYNPGGFQKEFHQLHFGRNFAAVTLVVGSLLLFSSSTPMATDLLLVMVMLYMVQGLAVSHWLVARAGANTGWLVALYLLLVLALPQTALTLAIAGFIDNWFDFRTIFGEKPKQ